MSAQKSMADHEINKLTRQLIEQMRGLSSKKDPQMAMKSAIKSASRSENTFQLFTSLITGFKKQLFPTIKKLKKTKICVDPATDGSYFLNLSLILDQAHH